MNADRWMDIARKEIGICEIAGIDHNQRIIDYHAVTRLKATDDETPWCASFVCWVLGSAGILHPRSAWSLSFLEWGEEIFTPRRGAIAVFERGQSKKTGHVGFVYGDSTKSISLLGGNQGNQVSIKPFSKDRLISLRWPDESLFLVS